MKYLFTLIVLVFVVSAIYCQELEIGQKAPDIILKSPNGEVVKLSSLKGKMVLIDFWASWCPPCRRENPELVRVYNKYKNVEFKNGSGFTIYSVSLDSHKQMWLGAISKDKLVWSNHVSDLKGWKSEAALRYNIKSIPYCYLIDKAGVIVAVNPRGEKLEAVLKKLRKK